MWKVTKPETTELWTNERRLKVLYEVVAVVTRAGDLEKALPRIAATVARHARVPVVLIERYHADRDTMELVAGHGVARHRGFTRPEFPARETIARQALERNRPVAQTGPPAAIHPLLRRRKTASALSVPLRLRRKLSGALTLVSPHRQEYSRDFLRLLQALTREIARLIQRADDEKRLPPAKLQASEEFLRMIVEGTPDIFFYVHDTNGVFTYLSPSVKKITGHTVEEWKDTYTKFLTPHPMNQVVRALTEESLRSGSPSPPYPCEIYHANGGTILLEVNERPIIREGSVVGIQGVARDITERKRLEEKILESRDFFNRLMDQTPIAIIVFDRDGNAVDVNGAWLRLFEAQNKSAVVGRLNLFTSERLNQPDVQKYVAAAYAGQVVDTPVFTFVPRQFIDAAGDGARERTARVKMSPVFDRNGGLVNVVAMIEDVTDRLQLQEQLLQSQKMESIGLLAGGIAHDFNNILSAILGYASYLKTIRFDDDQIYAHLDTIERSALRAAELTSQLMAFARGGRYMPGPLDVHEVIEETVRLLRGSFEKNIAIVTDLGADAPVIEGDGAQMQQVLMNLCVNARDAMPHGGTLTIRTRRLRKPDVVLLSRGADPERTYLRVDIADTGVGIEKTIQGRIFEPFFTTKEKGKGTGLGLATVYGIVEHHGGFIDFESEPGLGTTFSVYLPTVNRTIVSHQPEPARL
ncbi:MAG TPA: PAS domain S-box protein, partial [Bacteroidota bacterium]